MDMFTLLYVFVLICSIYNVLEASLALKSGKKLTKMDHVYTIASTYWILQSILFVFI